MYGTIISMSFEEVTTSARNARRYLNAVGYKKAQAGGCVSTILPKREPQAITHYSIPKRSRIAEEEKTAMLQ